MLVSLIFIMVMQKLQLKSEKLFWYEVSRIQEKYSFLLENARECLLEYSVQSSEGHYIEAAANELAVAVSPHDVFALTFPRGEYSSSVLANTVHRRVALVTQYYRKGGAYGDAHMALLKNLINPAISEIFLLNEDVYDFESLPFNDKIRQIHIGKRMTFSDAFLYINDALNGREVILGKMIFMRLHSADIYP
jgi:hypothetical protein